MSIVLSVIEQVYWLFDCQDSFVDVWPMQHKSKCENDVLNTDPESCQHMQRSKTMFLFSVTQIVVMFYTVKAISMHDKLKLSIAHRTHGMPYLPLLKLFFSENSCK